LKSVLQNQNHKRKKRQGIRKLNCTSISSIGQESDNFFIYYKSKFKIDENQ